MPRIINTHLIDSDTEVRTYMLKKLYKTFDKIEALRQEDEEGNQLLVLHYIDKASRYKNILNHLLYN